MLDAYPKTKDQIHYINNSSIVKYFLVQKYVLKTNIDILLHAKINLWTSTHIETRRQRYQVQNQQ